MCVCVCVCECICVFVLEFDVVVCVCACVAQMCVYGVVSEKRGPVFGQGAAPVGVLWALTDRTGVWVSLCVCLCVWKEVWLVNISL